MLGNWLLPGVPLLKGHSAAVLLPLAGLSIGITSAAAAVLRDRKRFMAFPQWTMETKIVWSALAGLWLLAFFPAIFRGESFSFAVFVIPVLLCTVFLLKFQRLEVERAASGTAWLALGLALAGLIVSRLSTDEWFAVFTHENIAGPILAISAAYWFSQRSAYPITLGAVAALIVLVSESATALMALIGSLALARFAAPLWSRRSGNLSSRPRKTQLLTSAIVAVTFVVAVMRDPSLNGRSVVWRAFLEAWIEHGAPWFGLGSSQLFGLMTSGRMPFWSHAHNQALDALVRLGPLALVGVVIVLAASLAAASKVVGYIQWPLAVVACVTIIGFLETPVDWFLISIPYIWMVLSATVVNAGKPRQLCAASKGGSEGGPE